MITSAGLIKPDLVPTEERIEFKLEILVYKGTIVDAKNLCLKNKGGYMWKTELQTTFTTIMETVF